MIRRIPKDIRDRHDSRLSLKQKVEVKPRATKTGVVEFHFRLHLFFFPDSSPPVEKPPRGTGETWMEKSLGRGRFGTSPDELEASWREGSSFAARGTSFRFKADAGASRGLSSARESLFLSRAFREYIRNRGIFSDTVSPGTLSYPRRSTLLDIDLSSGIGTASALPLLPLTHEPCSGVIKISQRCSISFFRAAANPGFEKPKASISRKLGRRRLEKVAWSEAAVHRGNGVAKLRECHGGRARGEWRTKEELRGGEKRRKEEKRAHSDERHSLRTARDRGTLYTPAMR